jgi:hypothetical protein
MTRDEILAEHASDVAGTVSSSMTAGETAGLRARFLRRIVRMESVDSECAALLLRGLGKPSSGLEKGGGPRLCWPRPGNEL